MNYILSIIFIFPLSLVSFAQINNSGYAALLQTLYSNSVPLISCEDLDTLSNPLILDIRSKSEYEVSHLKNSIRIGYEDYSKKKLSNIPKDTTIIVYCSIGKRSEAIGEKLIKSGYIRVYNLNGGIFEWVNQGYPVYKANLKKTNDIHPYSKVWGIWLEKGNKVYD